MTCKLLGRIDWSADVTEDWDRNYKIKWLVETDDPLDGPGRAMNCPGLPSPGSLWIFGNENDQYAYCMPNWTVNRFQTISEPSFHWVIEQPFTTKPTISQKQTTVSNPLAAPPQLGGSFLKYQEEQRYDRNTKPILSMTGEYIRGKSVEFDSNKPTVTIEINYPTLGLDVFSFLIDHVNDSAMWGLSKRMVKLSQVKWTRNMYMFGYYYTRSYDFDVDFKTFDRKIPEVGTKKLIAGGDKDNPGHWIVRRDPLGAILTDLRYYRSNGQEWRGFATDGDPASRMVEYYPETNLFQLGIPSSF